MGLPQCRPVISWYRERFPAVIFLTACDKRPTICAPASVDWFPLLRNWALWRVRFAIGLACKLISAAGHYQGRFSALREVICLGCLTACDKSTSVCAPASVTRCPSWAFHVWLDPTALWVVGGHGCPDPLGPGFSTLLHWILFTIIVAHSFCDYVHLFPFRCAGNVLGHISQCSNYWKHLLEQLLVRDCMWTYWEFWSMTRRGI